MLAGPSGVGKTETALALAEALYGGEQNLITINMSEFQEAHTVSTLKGAPPGYVGLRRGRRADRGGAPQALQRRAAGRGREGAPGRARDLLPGVRQGRGWKTARGGCIDFKNTLILLTTNVGTELIMSMCKDPELLPEPEGIAKALREPLLKVFPAALLGRIVAIPYYPLSDDDARRTSRGCSSTASASASRPATSVPFTYDDEVVKLIVSRCTELESGGRMIDAILTNTRAAADEPRDPRTPDGRPSDHQGRRHRPRRRLRLCLRLTADLFG